MVGQQGDIPIAILQWRQVDADDVEAIVKVLPEMGRLYVVFQIPVGSGDKPDVKGDGIDPPHPEELPLLDHPEELDLHRDGHVANLVQEYRAPIGGLQQTGFGLHRSGEGAFFMAEQFVGHQLLGKGAAVEGHEPLVAPETELVDRPGHQLLAGAAFPRLPGCCCPKRRSGGWFFGQPSWPRSARQWTESSGFSSVHP